MTRRGVAVTRRPKADEDLLSAVLWIRENGSPAVAEKFVDAVEAAIHTLTVHPLAGSDRLGTRLGIAGLRSYRVPRTPYLLFYLADRDRIEIVRVLHERRDIDGGLLTQ